MLSKEIMGVLALAIVWVNTLLVAGAAWLEIRALSRKRSKLRLLAEEATGIGLLEGEVVTGSPLACHRVEQIGRAGDDESPVIVFSDRSYKGGVLGGEIRAGERRVRIEGAEPAEVWLDAERLRRAAVSDSTEGFDRAYAEARKARGHVRFVDAPIEAGDRVWVFGELAREGDGFVLRPAPDDGMLVATLDPRAFCAAKIRLALACIAGVLVMAAAGTALALWPPAFGTVSTVGGAFCLAYFLLVQPLGTALRDAVRPPSRAIVRGRWARVDARARDAVHA